MTILPARSSSTISSSNGFWTVAVCRLSCRDELSEPALARIAAGARPAGQKPHQGLQILVGPLPATVGEPGRLERPAWSPVVLPSRSEPGDRVVEGDPVLGFHPCQSRYA